MVKIIKIIIDILFKLEKKIITHPIERVALEAFWTSAGVVSWRVLAMGVEAARVGPGALINVCKTNKRTPIIRAKLFGSL